MLAGRSAIAAASCSGVRTSRCSAGATVMSTRRSAPRRQRRVEHGVGVADRDRPRRALERGELLDGRPPQPVQG